MTPPIQETAATMQHMVHPGDCYAYNIMIVLMVCRVQPHLPGTTHQKFSARKVYKLNHAMDLCNCKVPLAAVIGIRTAALLCMDHAYAAGFETWQAAALGVKHPVSDVL